MYKFVVRQILFKYYKNLIFNITIFNSNLFTFIYKIKQSIFNNNI